MRRNQALPRDTLSVTPKRTTPSKPAPGQTERTHVVSWANVSVEGYKLLDLVQRQRKKFEKALGR